MKLSPVVIFTYNRPLHVSAVLEALFSCDLIDQSEVYIYSDGPKNESDIPKIEKIRSIIGKLEKENVHIINSKTNKGLASSIIGGINEVLLKHDRIIVLEDDTVVTKGFLTYMNAALNLYAPEKTVMHISGFMFPLKQALPETFFYNTASCWGWATWKDRWELFSEDQNVLYKKLLDDENLRFNFNVNGSADFFEQLQANIKGSMRTWAIKWYASIFSCGGFALHPGRSLVKNIGLDGSGEHCGNQLFEANNLTDSIKVEPIPIEEHPNIRKWMTQFNLKFYQKGIWQRLRNKISNLGS